MDTAEILFQYLKDVLYDTETAALDLDALPEDFQKFGQGMQLLGQWTKENRILSRSLAKGDLSYSGASRENVFAGPLKELQSTLRHLSWQTQQVAKGDYSQKVDFAGEFSEGFNAMTRQLQERKEALIEEKQQAEEKNRILERQNKELERAFDLVMSFANYTHNMIFIYSQKTGEELFRNEFADWFIKEKPKAGNELLERLKNHGKTELAQGNANFWEFELNFGKDNLKYYIHVESYLSIWKQQEAVVHIVLDNTDRKNRENYLHRLAYTDPLTGLYNLRYAKEQMHNWISEQIPFVISFIDVDYLKYCNDTLGHQAGDAYLVDIAAALGKVGGTHCRIGGDEFMIVQTQKTAAAMDEELERIRELVRKDGEKGSHPRCFSFASCEVPVNPDKKLEYYLKIADSQMYEYKKKHRTPLKDIVYKDHRKL